MSAPAAAAEAPIRWGADGLVPAVAQEAETGRVLMVGFVNAAALAATRATGVAHYWSRSRGKLWRKGETSGNEQEIVSISVNCEQNSLLYTVRQQGAVCHEGYPTCYYRRLEADGTLTVTMARAFDPVAVYGPATRRDEEGDRSLETATRAQWAAYAHLRDNDLEAVSATSRRLRGRSDPASRRVADELVELAGVIAGSHVHAESDQTADLVLEASQVVYWVTLAALWNGLDWDRVRPDLGLRPPLAPPQAESLAPTIAALADRWDRRRDGLARRIDDTFAVVADACAVLGVPPLRIVEHDLAELRQKPYLANVAASPPASR